MQVTGTRIAGAEDHVVNRTTGYLVAIGEMQALAHMIAKVVESPAMLRGLRSEVLRYAEENLQWKGIVRRIATNVYEGLRSV